MLTRQTTSGLALSKIAWRVCFQIYRFQALLDAGQLCGLYYNSVSHNWMQLFSLPRKLNNNKNITKSSTEQLGIWNTIRYIYYYLTPASFHDLIWHHSGDEWKLLLPCSLFILSICSGEKEERKSDPTTKQLNESLNRAPWTKKSRRKKPQYSILYFKTHILQKAESIFETSKGKPLCFGTLSIGRGVDEDLEEKEAWRETARNKDNLEEAEIHCWREPTTAKHSNQSHRKSLQPKPLMCYR